MEIISRKTRIDVVEGDFGKYVKITRTDPAKPPRWLNLSPSMWQNLRDAMQDVEALVMGKEQYEVESSIPLTYRAQVYVVDFSGSRYVGLNLNRTHGEKIYRNRMNFALAEWKRITQCAKSVQECLDGRDEIIFYAAEQEDGRYGSWYLDLNRCRSTDEGVNVKMSFVPRPTALQWIECVIDHVLSKALREMITDKCNGCIIDHPSQMEHNCMMVDWPDAVDNYFSEVRRNVSYKTVELAVKKVLTSLSIACDTSIINRRYHDKRLSKIL